MAYMKASKNFVWDSQQSLGHGATSVVYLGRSKRTFEKVAVKVFTPASFQRAAAIQTREFEVMRKLNHKNIVRLIAIEEENQTYNKVIVMEFCPHGSLFNMMEDNAFGLQEEEMLLVLQHVANGMKHLRSNAVVHRDVKPGNILRCIDPDGKSVYKLTDFGAARELQDEESFMSLYGTEEYLHPHMYEQAVLRKDNSRIFNASVDLWSIGVTYYHMATGQLPFRPYGGRRNKELMYKIVSQKEKGVVSGVQLEHNSPILWSRELPGTCLLSNGLKMYLTPILAALLEINPDHVWTFEQYFENVDEICSKAVVHAFCPTISSSLRIYLDKDDSLKALSENITKQTEISTENQLLLFDNQPLETTIDSLLTIKNYPDNIIEQHPIFIFNKVEEFHPYPDPVHIAPFPTLSSNESGIQMNLEMDYRIVKQSIKIGHSVKTATHIIVNQNKLLHLAVKQYSNDLNQDIEVQNATLKHVTQFCNTTRIWNMTFIKTVGFQLDSLGILYTLHSVQCLNDLIITLQQIKTEAETEINSKSTQIQELLREVTAGSKKLKTSHLEAKQLTMEWNFQDGCLSTNRCTEIIGELVQKLEDSALILKENRAKRTIPFNDEQIHKYEKSQIKMFTESIKQRLTTHCCPRAHDLYKAYQVWYKKATASRAESVNTKQTMNTLIQLQSSFYKSYSDFVERYLSILDEKLPEIQESCSNMEQQKNMTSSSGSSMASKAVRQEESMNIRRQKAGDILEGLKSSRSSMEEMVQLVKENNSIIGRFESLSTFPENWEHP